MTNKEKVEVLECMVDTIKRDLCDEGCSGCKDFRLCRSILENDTWEDVNGGDEK